MVATLPNGARGKINQAQSDGGVTEAKSVIAQFLGIPGFDRYMILRIDATKEFVAAIGGVDVDVKSSNCLKYKTGCTGETLDYDDSWGHLHIHFKEGMQHLNGEQAVAYMRFRHDWCSDPCRIMRQQQVMHAMATKLRGDRVNTFMHLGSLLTVFRKYVQTDFSDEELLAIASHFQGMSDNAIVNNQVPYTTDIDLPVYGNSLLPDVEARTRLVQCDAARAAGARAVARCHGAGGDRPGNAAGGRPERKRYQRRGPARRRCLAQGGIYRGRRWKCAAERLRDDRNPRAFDRVVCRCEGARVAAGGAPKSDGGAGPVTGRIGRSPSKPDHERRDGDRRRRPCQSSAAHGRSAGDSLVVMLESDA